MKVLIADDEAPARERLRRLLAEIGAPWRLVGEAVDGADALALCRAQPIDVALHAEEPEGSPRNVVRGRVTEIVIDVLRTSTTIVSALWNGARAVVPVGSTRLTASRAGRASPTSPTSPRTTWW